MMKLFTVSNALLGVILSNQSLTLNAREQGLDVSQIDAAEMTEEEDWFTLQKPAPINWYLPHRLGQAVLSASLINSISEAVGVTRLPLPSNSEDGIVIQTTVLSKSSPRHSDHYPHNHEGIRPSVGSDRVAFIALNTNDDAYFELGENGDEGSAPIIKGSVVSFEGGTPHRTVVRSGTVSLLGPFDIHNFQTVGGGVPANQSQRAAQFVIWQPSGFGDPHFQKWDGTRFDYHGECDLVMNRSPNFANGLGFHLHVRTKVVDNWSYIETVALKIGEDVLEVSAKGVYSVNGIPNADLSTNSKVLSGYPVTYFKPGSLEHELRWYRFEVDLGDAGRVVIKSFANKPFMAVLLEDCDNTGKYYEDSLGLMGTYGASIMLARDGLTVHHDANEFGQEWQVHPDEDPLIFQDIRAPQYPEQKCMLPPPASAVSRKKDRRHRRRLSESVSEHQAEAACAGWSDNSKDECIFDVMATGDLELAQAGGY